MRNGHSSALRRARRRRTTARGGCGGFPLAGFPLRPAVEDLVGWSFSGASELGRARRPRRRGPGRTGRAAGPHRRSAACQRRRTRRAARCGGPQWPAVPGTRPGRRGERCTRGPAAWRRATGACRRWPLRGAGAAGASRWVAPAGGRLRRRRVAAGAVAVRATPRRVGGGQPEGPVAAVRTTGLLPRAGGRFAGLRRPAGARSRPARRSGRPARRSADRVRGADRVSRCRARQHRLVVARPGSGPPSARGRRRLAARGPVGSRLTPSTRAPADPDRPPPASAPGGPPGQSSAYRRRAGPGAIGRPRRRCQVRAGRRT